jgi:hypothetical protein
MRGWVTAQAIPKAVAEVDMALVLLHRSRRRKTKMQPYCYERLLELLVTCSLAAVAEKTLAFSLACDTAPA